MSVEVTIWKISSKNKQKCPKQDWDEIACRVRLLLATILMDWPLARDTALCFFSDSHFPAVEHPIGYTRAQLSSRARWSRPSAPHLYQHETRLGLSHAPMQPDDSRLRHA